MPVFCFCFVTYNRMQTSLQRVKMKNQNKNQSSKIKRSPGEVEEEEIILLNETIRLIDTLFEMRFIQKISRPIEKRTKEEYVQKFAGRMESLHNKLEKIRFQIGDKSQSQNGNTKAKSVAGSATHKPIDWKKSIRAIENRYIEVLIEGSFKFYPKLHQLNSFSYSLKTINIEEWATSCLSQQLKQNSCC